MITMYIIAGYGEYAFTTRQAAVATVKTTWSKVAKVVANAPLTQCTLVFNDTTKPPAIVHIGEAQLLDGPTHL